MSFTTRNTNARPTQDQMDRALQRLRALDGPSRYNIASQLHRHSGETIESLATVCNTSPEVVRRDLNRLIDADLVHVDVDQVAAYYTLNQSLIQRMQAAIQRFLYPTH